MNEKIHIGTSGWSYPDWKEIFYPKGLKSVEWLAHYSQTFKCTEINSSFYHLPTKKTVEGWVNKVPDDFRFCPKMSKHLTHIKRLQEPEESFQRFFEVFDVMKPKMGPILIQLPPSLKFNPDTAEHLYILLKSYSPYRFALEGRHSTWLEEDSIQLMKRYNISFVISQSGDKFPYGEFVTSKDVYVRFHGPKELFASLYPLATLKKFATLFESWLKDKHVLWIFFNNDFYGYAIKNALQLDHLLKTQTVSSLHTLF